MFFFFNFFNNINCVSRECKRSESLGGTLLDATKKVFYFWTPFIRTACVVAGSEQKKKSDRDRRVNMLDESVANSLISSGEACAMRLVVRSRARQDAQIPAIVDYDRSSLANS